MRIHTKAAIALAVSLALPLAAQAHRPWLLPSSTVLSGADQWVTVDAAMSDQMFAFDGGPIKLDDLKVYGPDGTEVRAENPFTGKFRSSFDLHLEKPGTYRMSVMGDSLMGRYKLNGEDKRWRGTPDKLAEIPKEATDLEIIQNQRRQDTFVTSGKPTDAALEPTGSGLEMVPVTHPNDLVAGSEATFKFILDGKPAANIEVTVIPDGTRYRDQIDDMRLKTDAQGAVTVTWPAAGLYWLGAQAKDAKPTIDKAKSRTASYAATLEVQVE